MGTVSTKLQQTTKCGKLDFGNCWNAGVVKAYFDNKLIGEAPPNTPNRVVEFPIPKDGELKIRDEGAYSIIKFTKFELVECTSEDPGNVPMPTATATSMYSQFYVETVYI